MAFPDAQSLDFVGPLEVFGIAERLSPGRYSTEIVAPGGRRFATNGGLSVDARRVHGACPARSTRSWWPAGWACGRPCATARLVRWLGGAAGRSRRVASVCTGAFLLAEAGLLDGRRVATHWASADRLAERYPGSRSTPTASSCATASVWTSAGVTAGMDLALALVEDDFGPEAALEVARWLVVFVKRPGGQSQFSAALAAQAAERKPLREVQEWVRANPAGDCSVEALAGRACMSPRNFSRAFGAEVGMTPAAWVEASRVDLRQGPARDHLRTDRGGRRGVRLRDRRDPAAGVRPPRRA